MNRPSYASGFTSSKLALRTWVGGRGQQRGMWRQTGGSKRWVALSLLRGALCWHILNAALFLSHAPARIRPPTYPSPPTHKVVPRLLRVRLVALQQCIRLQSGYTLQALLTTQLVSTAVPIRCSTHPPHKPWMEVRQCGTPLLPTCRLATPCFKMQSAHPPRRCAMRHVSPSYPAPLHRHLCLRCSTHLKSAAPTSKSWIAVRHVSPAFLSGHTASTCAGGRRGAGTSSAVSQATGAAAGAAGASVREGEPRHCQEAPTIHPRPHHPLSHAASRRGGAGGQALAFNPPSVGDPGSKKHALT